MRQKRRWRGVGDRREDCGYWETEEKIARSERQERRLRGLGDRREDCGEWETEEKRVRILESIDL